jgi:lysophospholipase L1-like esterase
MDAWSDHGAAPEQFIAADGLHHNNLGYHCIAMALAGRIAAAVSAPISVAASH